MKLWIKIYIFSLVLMAATLNIAGFTLIQKLHNDSLRKEVSKAISEEKIVASELKNASMFYQDQFADKSKEEGTIIRELMDKYKGVYERRSGSVEILDDKNEILYSDMKFPKCESKDELQSLAVGKNNYVIRTINNRQYLYTAEFTQVYNLPVKVRYAIDISDVYSEKVSHYTFFAKLDIMICFLFAIFMFFISRFITKPINVLIDSTKKIASGQYSERVIINSKDEFKKLANDFNCMAETVENNINKLQDSNRAKETFINNFTHELKTPLTSIIGYASLIKTSKYDEKLFVEAADYIEKEGRRLESMAFKMMDFIYAKDGAVQLKPENIMEIIEDVKKSLLVKLRDKNIKLILEGQKTVLDVDKDLFTILLRNLIENAIKASEENSNIFLKIESLDNKAVLHIMDSGTGISKDDIEKIFEPFYVADKARSRKNNGVGIGLSICKRIVESLNAEIMIDSKKDVGTDAKVIFKLHK